MLLSHIDVSLPLFLPPLPSLKIKKSIRKHPNKSFFLRRNLLIKKVLYANINNTIFASLWIVS